MTKLTINRVWGTKHLGVHVFNCTLVYLLFQYFFTCKMFMKFEPYAHYPWELPAWNECSCSHCP